MVLFKIWYAMDNMQEKETFEPIPEVTENPFADIEAMQQDQERFAASARRVIEEESPSQSQPTVQAPEASTDRKSGKRAAFAAGAVVAAAGVLGVPAAVNAIGEAVDHEPTFSSATTEYTLNDGESIWDAAEHVKGAGTSADIRDVVHHIEVDPANVDILKDGVHPGTTITIPLSVGK